MDYYSVDGNEITLSIETLLGGLAERLNNEKEYGPGLFDIATTDYISECANSFKKTPKIAWLKIKSDLTTHAHYIISSN